MRSDSSSQSTGSRMPEIYARGLRAYSGDPAFEPRRQSHRVDAAAFNIETDAKPRAAFSVRRITRGPLTPLADLKRCRPFVGYILPGSNGSPLEVPERGPYLRGFSTGVSLMAKRVAHRIPRPWTKEDVRELKTHSRARTPVIRVSKAMKRTVGALRRRAGILGIGLGHRR